MALISPISLYPHYKDMMLEEAEKLYNVLVDQLDCEVINESISKQPTADIISSPALPLEEDDNKQDDNKQDAISTKDDLNNL